MKVFERSEQNFVVIDKGTGALTPCEWVQAEQGACDTSRCESCPAFENNEELNYDQAVAWWEGK